MKKKFFRLIRITGEYQNRVKFKQLLDLHGISYRQFHNNIGQEFIFDDEVEYQKMILIS